MPDDAAPSQDQPRQQQPGQQEGAAARGQGAVLRVHERDTKTSYANVCLLSSTREEMILNFGLTVPSAQREQRETHMMVSDRIIMSLPAAKRLAIALSQGIQRYENAFGVIEAHRGQAPGPQASPDVQPPPSQ
ncbi:MAG: DUF3467 domain-containing protein [Planctomycetota bacterium]